MKLLFQASKKIIQNKFLYQNNVPETTNNTISETLDLAVKTALEGIVKETKTLKELVEAKRLNKETLAEELKNKIETQWQEKFSELEPEQKAKLTKNLKEIFKDSPEVFEYLEGLINKANALNTVVASNNTETKKTKGVESEALNETTESEETTQKSPEISKEAFEEVKQIQSKINTFLEENPKIKEALGNGKFPKQLDANYKFEDLNTNEKQSLSKMVLFYQVVEKLLDNKDAKGITKELLKIVKVEQTNISLEENTKISVKKLDDFLSKAKGIPEAERLTSVIIKKLEDIGQSVSKFSEIDLSKIKEDTKEFICKTVKHIEEKGLLALIALKTKEAKAKIKSVSETILESLRTQGGGPLKVPKDTNSAEYKLMELDLAKEASYAGVDDAVAKKYIKYRMKKNGSLNFDKWYQAQIDGGEIKENQLETAARKITGLLRRIGAALGAFLGGALGERLSALAPDYIKDAEEALKEAEEAEEDLESWEGKSTQKLENAFDTHGSLYSFLEPDKKDGKIIGAKGLSVKEFNNFENTIKEKNAKEFTQFAKGKEIKVDTYENFEHISKTLNNSQVEMTKKTGTNGIEYLSVALKDTTGKGYRADKNGKALHFTLDNAEKLDTFIDDIDTELNNEEPKYTETAPTTNQEVKNEKKEEKIEEMPGKTYANFEELNTELNPIIKETFDLNGIDLPMGNEPEARKELIEFIFNTFKGKNLDTNDLIEQVKNSLGKWNSFLQKHSLEYSHQNKDKSNKKVEDFIKNYTHSSLKNKK